MFIIGILSTPLPYFLLAFAYVVGMSMGFFQKHDQLATEEEFVSTIISYEKLTPSEEYGNNDAHYHDFILQLKLIKAQSANFDLYIASFDQAKTFSPPLEEFLQYNYLHTSNLFSRPPPIIG
ncbi:MAG: hypothetical protein ACERKD_18275 [Prolixibacteraceae bacterium]